MLIVTAVSFDSQTLTWLLSTPSTSYALRAVDDGLWHVYWGPRLSLPDVAALPIRPQGHSDVLGEEFPAGGGERFGPTSLVVEFADGTGVVEWTYVGHDIDDGHLTVTLADRHYPVELELHYRVRPDTDVIERWVALRHTGGDDPVAVRTLNSAAWSIPERPDYRLSSVAGEWSAEFQVQRVTAPLGETTITSRRGITRHQQNPWLMVDPGDATEGAGEVWSTVLAWGGTWRITARRTLGGQLAVTGGAGSVGAGTEGAGWRLQPGESRTTPVYAGLYATDGFGGTSRRWHEYVRAHVLPAPAEVRPVLYNSWEGTWFDVNENNQREIAAIAAEMGAELFVMDDGWFGRRVDDFAGLGDWDPNPDRFPNGLGPLIAEVHKLGMRFGIWVEPEMVNPDSDLYRKHPEWVLHMPNRRRTEIRNQLVLNFARPDVVEWAHGWLDRLLSENEIDFVKWDMNRSFTEAGWPGHDDPNRLFTDHTANVYAILDRLRADHPNLRIETCASGGGRVDLGILRRTDQAWTSDNTDPVDRLAIQDGYTQVYPAITMGAWASDSPNPLNSRVTPVRFRFHVAMAGALGISGNLREWSAQDRQEAAELIARYKEIRHIVAHGALYRLTPPSVERLTAVQYVSADEAEVVVLAFRAMGRHGQPQPAALRLGGLDPAATYRDEETGALYSGAVLTHHGLDLGLPAGDYASVLRHLRRT
ncbi:MAG TPA: alpha-galactosidase [Micromonosporaceae bacterium]|nr:alpha-galactosidase [Micromonosporaceae bacterium]